VNCTSLRILSLSTARAETTEQRCIWSKAPIFLTRFHQLWLMMTQMVTEFWYTLLYLIAELIVTGVFVK